MTSHMTSSTYVLEEEEAAEGEEEVDILNSR